jgi:hypothetical protein
VRRFTFIFVLAGCGGPVARNIPAPNKAVAAGITAGAAAAITLADPAAAAKRQEENKTAPDLKEQKSKGTVPADVLDRLDEKKKNQNDAAHRTSAPGAEPPGAEAAPGAEPPGAEAPGAEP